MPDKTLLIKHIPEDLHRDFKALCAREGVTMGWKVRELINHYIIETNRKEGER
jgi:predicted DNA-binding protein